MLAFALIRIAWRNVVQNRRKTLMAILAIASGFIALNLFQGYIHDAENMFDDSYARRGMLGDLLVERTSAAAASRTESTEHFLSAEEQAFFDQLVKENPKIANRVRFLNLSGMVTNGRANAVFSGYGYDLEEGHKMRQPTWGWNVLAGKPLNMGANGDVVIGRLLGEILDCREKTRLSVITGVGGYKAEERPFSCRLPRLQLSVSTIHGQANAADVEVFGITDAVFTDLDLRFVAMPLAMAQQLLDTTGISMISVSLANGADPMTVASEISEAARQKGFEWSVRPWKAHEIGEFYNQSIEFLHVFRNFILVIILVIAILSVLNTQMRIVRERTREIGTLRSIGFKVRHVRAIFIAESVFLGWLGIAVGVALSLLIATTVNSLAIPYRIGVLAEAVPFTMSVTMKLTLESALILTLVSIVAAIIPTERAVRRKVVECLTSV